MEYFSPAQSAGYVSFVLGTAAFLQSSDRGLKKLNSLQGLVYALHFTLLGNIPAATSSLISGGRSFLSLRYRSARLAWLIVATNVAVGATVVRSGAGWLPVAASCAATFGMFMMQGIPLRIVLLGCTSMWLTNNILSHSIGGTLLELVIGAANVTTIWRMVRARRPKRDAAVDGAAAES